MGTVTGIQWTAHSASPWYGCQHKVAEDGTPHPGCLHCYAETNAGRNPKTLGIWGPNGTRVASKSFHKNCKTWNAAAQAAGVRQSVFPSICDPFENWHGPILNSQGRELRRRECGSIVAGSDGCPREAAKDGCDCEASELLTMDDLRRDLFATIDDCPWLDFLLLTKRPENIRQMWHLGGIPHPESCQRSPEENTQEWRRRLVRTQLRRNNVQLIYSASDQQSLETGIDHLLACKDLVPVVGLSLEPLVGPIELAYPESLFPNGPRMCCNGRECGCMGMPVDPWPWLYEGINWVIVGGESGHGARPCDVAWIRSIVRQCKEAGVPCFVKQLGADVVGDDEPRQPRPDGKTSYALGTWLLQDKKGGDWSEWPEDLRVRQFPEVARD